MKVLPFKIPKPENSALIYQVDKGLTFYDQLHAHEEIQISIVLKGSGNLIVGDTIGRYDENDVVVLGSQLPHLFQSDENDEESLMFTLFFSESSFGSGFFELNEFNEMKEFFQKSTKGMRLLDTKEAIKNEFLNLENYSKLELVSGFFKIVKLITEAESKPLSTFIYEKHFTEKEGSRMSKVMSYAMQNYRKEITLDEIADVANMTPNAFCRYFKKRTNKTFFQFLIEIRLENACQLLSQKSEMSIAEISDQSGFRNIAFFNRKFKTYKETTPTQFRNESLGAKDF